MDTVDLFKELGDAFNPNPQTKPDIDKALDELEKAQNDFFASIDNICKDYEMRHPERKKIVIADCPDCNGMGWNYCPDNFGTMECSACEGTGKVKI